MDYSQYKKLEFRRRVFSFIPIIKMFDPISGTQLGYIRMKLFSWRSDIRLYTDSTKEQEIVLIKARNIVRVNMCFDVFDSGNNQLLFSLQHRGLRSIFKRDYWNLLDKNGTNFGAIKETSGTLALARRWIVIIPYIGPLLEAILAFTPQTFDYLSSTPTGEFLNAGKIIHRKNPFKVKLGVDYSSAQVSFDPKLYIASAALLAILDASKRN